ncbi:sensor histidine kinase [Aliikangiella sp. IMCC44653]
MNTKIMMLSRVLAKVKQLNPFKDYASEQAGLVLIASVPCLTLALFCMRFAGASYYLISFFAIIFLLLIIYAALTGKNRANYQLQTLSNLVEAMIDGDYTLRGRKQSNPAFQDLLNRINLLADNLHKHKLKAEESQLLLEKIIQQMDVLVFATDNNNHIVMINDAARKTLGFNSSLDNGYKLSDIGMEDLVGYKNSGVVKLNKNSISGEFVLFKDQFYSDNQKHQLFLLTRIEKLLKEKEREAWQNLLRVLSHELNNSLTPIATFSTTMLRKINKEQQVTDIEKFKDGLSIIKERAESLNQFITSYSQLSHLPQANKQDFNWAKKLKQLSKLFPDCCVINNFKFKQDPKHVIQADPHQMEQVFINLLKNAREAMAGLELKKIEINAEVANENLIITIKDCGSGIANPKNLFVPFYTTKKSGSGIGLTLCQQILSSHDATLHLTNRENSAGAQATIVFPVKVN